MELIAKLEGSNQRLLVVMAESKELAVPWTSTGVSKGAVMRLRRMASTWERRCCGLLVEAERSPKLYLSGIFPPLRRRRGACDLLR